MTDVTWALAILLAAGLVASSALGYIVIAVGRLAWARWRADRRTRRRLGDLS